MTFNKPDRKEQTPELLTIEEAAQLLRKSRVTIHRYVAQGKVRAYQVAGTGPLLFKREELLALLVPARPESLQMETCSPINGKRGRPVASGHEEQAEEGEEEQ